MGGTEVALFATALLMYIAFSGKRLMLRSAGSGSQRPCSATTSEGTRGARHQGQRDFAKAPRDGKFAPKSERRTLACGSTSPVILDVSTLVQQATSAVPCSCS